MKCLECGYFNLPQALICGRCGMDLAHPTPRPGGSLQESLYPPRARSRTLGAQVQARVHWRPPPPLSTPVKTQAAAWAVTTAAVLPGLGHLLRGEVRRGAMLLLMTLGVLGAIVLTWRLDISDVLLWGLAGLAGWSVWDVAARAFPPANTDSESEYLRVLRLGFLCVTVVASTLASLFWLAGRLYPRYDVTNDQMAPLLAAGDQVLTRRTARPLDGLRHGDVIVARSGEFPLIERVIGLPGDAVQAEGGVLRVNGRLVSRRGLPLDSSGRAPSRPFWVIVPPGQVCVWQPLAGTYPERGEGGPGSQPVATFTTINAEEITGRGVIIIEPPTHRQWIR